MSTPLVSARAVRGELRLRAERDATGKTVLADRHAAGAFHLSKPYWDGHALMVQWINPTAGIFAGDVLTSEVSVGRDAALLVTTPSATRIHARADPSTAPGRQTQRFEVANNGFLEVLPEWLIPQAGSAFEQVTTIHLEERASLFYAELMAMAGRYKELHDRQYAPHIEAVRSSVPGREELFLVNPQGLHWSEVRTGDMLLINGQGEVLEGRHPLEPTAFFIHSRTFGTVPSQR